MDTTQYAEGQYINPELVKKSPSKRVYISGDVKVVPGKFGDKLELPVELDGKPKTWGLNRNHVKALHVFGRDSKQWVGKEVKLSVVNISGKEEVIAEPIQNKEEVIIG